MSDRRPDNDEMREFLDRLEREFHSRPTPPPSPYESPGGQAIETAQREPQRVRLSLPLARPRVVYALLAANVIMFVLTELLARRIGFGNALDLLGWKENAKIDAGQYWRLLTPIVLHGSLTHLLFNSWALYALGTEAERIFGTLRFTAIYLIAGLAGSVASYVFNPLAPSVGASGAIFGLFGALAAFSYAARSLIGWEASKMQLGQMATLVVINLAFGFLPGTNIDNSAHIGGLVAGGIAGLALAPRYAVDRRAYVPALQRADSPAVGWGVALGVLLVVLAGFFVARMV